MPFFSIILPTYNRAGFLSKAIESVRYQTYKDWELIIVDDGSTDDTKHIVQEFIKHDKRIKYIYQENAERSAARNKGIEDAKGEFICFLDSDDYYHPTHLQCFKDLIAEHPEKPALYFSGVSMNQFDDTPCQYNENHQTAQEFVLLNTLATPRACVSSKLLLNEIFDVNIRIGEDKELWCRIALKYPVYYHHKKTVIQIDHDGRSIVGKSVYDNERTLKYILTSQTLRKEIAKKLKSSAYFNIGKYELAQQNRWRAFSFFLKSLLVDPKNKQSKLKVNVLFRLLGLRKIAEINRII